MAAPLNQQQQLKNEATKMAMWVPLFYGNKKEDNMNIKDFITRFESACTAMGLEGHMRQECYSRINKNAPCVDRNGRPLSSVGKLATVEDDQDAELDTNLIRRMNGFIRSVQDQEDQDDLNSDWGPGAPLPDLLMTVVTRLKKCP